MIILVLLAVLLIPFLSVRNKGLLTVSVVAVFGIVSGYYSVQALAGYDFNILLKGSVIFGNVPVRIDSLSGWFILLINFTLITGSLYGLSYMKSYRERKRNISLHCIAYLILQFAITGICAVQNGFIFLLLWELMALSVFILIIFDHEKPDTIKAGLNYLVQSHISIVFLVLGFIYVAFKTGNYGFDAIVEFSKYQTSLAGMALFLCFFIGFAIKAGFVPFHTWLPYAHPAAPTHVSGVMSGIVIKIGIYGILRMLLLIRTDYTTVGYILLVISVVTGIYGVMLATIQHNLKKLLAYHSIENIGIIGIGIGLGCIGLGASNKWMTILGFSGAMLHTLNHSLFKSLLFYSSGNVYQSASTLNIEKMGGLMKQMPRTALLFLFAAIAICGLPPLNGFISEFLIYGGLYNWLYSADIFSLITIVFTIGGLVLIGGLAVLCFTKAFSIIFLGNPRDINPHEIKERSLWQLFPMYMTGLFMIVICIMPSFFLKVLQRPVNLYTHDVVFNLNLIKVGAIDSLTTINLLFLGFILLIILIFRLRKFLTAGKKIETDSTWGCGYSASDSKIQYTASSYVRSYVKLAKPILDIEKREMEMGEVFPGGEKHYETDPYDKIERVLIDKPLKLTGRIPEFLLFLQNGRLQTYILYGIIFITCVIGLPLIIEKIKTLIHFLNNL